MKTCFHNGYDLFKQFTKAQNNMHTIIRLWINWFENQLSRRHLFAEYHSSRNHSKIEDKIQVKFVEDKNNNQIAQNSSAFHIVSLVLFQPMSAPTSFLPFFDFFSFLIFYLKVLFENFGPSTYHVDCWIVIDYCSQDARSNWYYIRLVGPELVSWVSVQPQFYSHIQMHQRSFFSSWCSFHWAYFAHLSKINFVHAVEPAAEINVYVNDYHRIVFLFFFSRKKRQLSNTQILVYPDRIWFKRIASARYGQYTHWA